MSVSRNVQGSKGMDASRNAHAAHASPTVRKQLKCAGNPEPFPPNLIDAASLTATLVWGGQPLYRNVQWFRGGLVFEAHRLLYHSA